MFQIAPCTNTLCSYSATERPQGVRREPLGQDRVARLIAGESVAAPAHWVMPSASNSSAVLPNARFALREHVRHQQIVLFTERTVVRLKPMKSEATRLVP